jgi:integrase
MKKIDSSAISLQIQIVLKILLFSGKRLSEVLTAEESEIDFKKRIWTIPATKTKNGIQDKIYLTDTLVTLFNELKSLSKSNWFCASMTKKKDHIQYRSVSRAVKRDLDHFEFKEPWTPHDLRRTVATHMNEKPLNILPHIVEKILNHKLQGIMAVYDKSKHWKEKIKAWKNWESRIYVLMNTGKVISINSKKKA